MIKISTNALYGKIDKYYISKGIPIVHEWDNFDQLYKKPIKLTIIMSSHLLQGSRQISNSKTMLNILCDACNYGQVTLICLLQNFI